MADGGVIRRIEAPERKDYRRALQKLIDVVDELEEPKPNVEQWKKQRAITIRVLNELKEKLDAVCVSTNRGKVAGYVAQIFGVIGAVVGVLMSTFRQNAGPLITNTGNLVRHSGSCIEDTSKAIESLFSGICMREIEKALEADQKLSLPLAESLKFSKELDANVQQIFGVSLTSEKWSSVLGMFQKIPDIVSSGGDFRTSISRIKQDKYSVNIEKEEISDKLLQFCQHLEAFPNLGDKMQKTLRVLTPLTSAFRVYNDGVRLQRYVKDIPSSPTAPILRGGLEPEIPTAKEVSFFCFFQAINLANSVISLITAKNVIEKGKSKYCEALNELISSLAGELKSMEGFQL